MIHYRSWQPGRWCSPAKSYSQKHTAVHWACHTQFGAITRFIRCKQNMASQSYIKQCWFVVVCCSFFVCWAIYRKLDDRSTVFVEIFFNGSSIAFKGEMETDVLQSLVDNRDLLDLVGELEQYQDPFALMEDNSQRQEEQGLPHVHNTKETSENPTAKLSARNSSNFHCSHDDHVKALICSVNLTPKGLWKKAFDPRVLRMDVTYNLEDAPIRIEARACSCGKNVRIGSKDGPINSTTWVLEAGQSVLALYVSDDSHSKQWVYSKYYLVLHRSTEMHVPGNFSSLEKYDICRLYQDCGMWLDKAHTCGLTSVGDSSPTTWLEFTNKLDQKEPCRNGHYEGYWTVPCHGCDDSRNCFWNQARWTTEQCVYLVDLDISKVKLALKGKTLIFFGDSTLRGMMYYMIEKLNGTLNEWSVIHDSVVLENVNSRNTKFMFVYYPQFWLPADKKKNSLKSLFKDFGHFQNSSNTVLVTGGVQWIDIHFLHSLRENLQAVGLTGIDVVVKGYGTGFNVPAAGILFRTFEEQNQVAIKNRGLVREALKLGFKVVDTFWMTSSRFKQYLHGKCACHFHHVSHVFNSFRVRGQINKAYSDILLQIVAY